MFQLTHAAVLKVDESRRAQGLPESVGLRIFGQSQTGGQVSLGLAFAEAPAEDDEVTITEGTRVFLAPEVAGPLDSAALDVTETGDGAAFVLTDQIGGTER